MEQNLIVGDTKTKSNLVDGDTEMGYFRDVSWLNKILNMVFTRVFHGMVLKGNFRDVSGVLRRIWWVFQGCFKYF